MRFRISLLVLPLLFAVSANAQDQLGDQGYVVHPNQEVQVSSLPSVVADSSSDADVLVASVAIAVKEPEVCCARSSALVDQVASVTKLSLKELGQKLRGKHYFDSGAPLVITDQYWPGASVNSEEIVGSLLAQRPLLATWNGHLYVLYGAVFNEYVYDSGARMHAIQKLLLLDTRFDDDRRYVIFNRSTDDWGKVSGLLSLTITK